MKSSASEDQVFENLPALFVVLELIEAGARRREQNDIARLCCIGRFAYSNIQRPGVDDGGGAFDVRNDFFSRSANGVDGLHAFLNEGGA